VPNDDAGKKQCILRSIAIFLKNKMTHGRGIMGIFCQNWHFSKV